MTHVPDIQECPYNRVHIASGGRELVEHAYTDLADEDPGAQALEQIGVTTVTLRFVNGETLSYSKRSV